MIDYFLPNNVSLRLYLVGGKKIGPKDLGKESRGREEHFPF